MVVVLVLVRMRVRVPVPGNHTRSPLRRAKLKSVQW